MYTGKKQKKTVLWIILAAFALLLLVLFQRFSFREDLSEEAKTAVRNAIQKAARQCYVVEGAYPPDLAYLEDNYGLQVNKTDFYITYNAFAENLPPDVRVKGKHE